MPARHHNRLSNHYKTNTMTRPIKYLLAIILSMAVTCNAYAAAPLKFNVDIFEFTEIADKPGYVEVSLAPNSRYFNQRTIEIPATVAYNGLTYSVLGIAEQGFAGPAGGLYMGEEKVREIIISEGIEYIKESGFEYSLLTDYVDNFVLPSTLKKLGAKSLAKTGIKELTIPDGVVEIGYGTFFGCTELKKLTLGKGLINIPTILGYWWYSPQYPQYFDGVRHLYVAQAVPPTVIANEFDQYETHYVEYLVNTPTEFEQLAHHLSMPQDYVNCTLHVPAGCAEAYRSHPAWGKFKTIVDDTESGIEEIVSADKGVIKVKDGRIVAEGHLEVYDIGGRKLAEGPAESLPDMPAGLYIVHSEAGTAKVAL